MGEDCRISPGVVVGRSGNFEVPVIGNRVQLEAGCKVLGPIRVGDDCVIGPNAVLIQDLLAGSACVAPLGRLLDPKNP